MNDEERIEHKPDGGKSRDWVGNFLADSACGTNLTHKFLKFYHQFILPNSILWKCFWTFQCYKQIYSKRKFFTKIKIKK